MNKRIILIAIIISLGFAVYFNTIFNEFVYDDRSVIIENSMINNFSGFISHIFDEKYFNYSQETTYRPIATLTYFVVYHFFKLNPLPYHLFSIFLHLANAFLVFILFSRIFKNDITGFFISIIFMLHPIVTEPVNCISYNEDLIFTFFYLISFIFYIKGKENNNKRIIYFIISAASYFFSCFSKEMAVTLPVLIVIYDFLNKVNEKNKYKLNHLLSSFKQVIKSNIGYYLAFFVITAIYLYVLFVGMKSPDKDLIITYGADSLFLRILFVPYNLMLYLKMIFFPIGLSAVYNFHYPVTFISLPVIISYIIFLFYILSFFMLYKYSLKLSYGYLWFFISMLPVLNIIPIHRPIADRILYLPSIGFVVISGYFISMLFEKVFKNDKKYIFKFLKLSLPLIIITFFVFLTVNRNIVWRNETSFWNDVLKKNPCAEAYCDLGRINVEKPEAEGYFKKAIELDSMYTNSYINLSALYIRNKRYDEALNILTEYQKLFPGKTDYINNLAILYVNMGKSEEALKLFQNNTEYNKENELNFIALGKQYRDKNMYNDAIKAFKDAIAINSASSEAHYELGELYYKLNDLDKALIEYNNAVKYNPGHYLSLLKLGELYAKKGNFINAEKALLEAVKINPDYPGAYFNLGSVYAMEKNYKNALKQFKKVLEFDPGNEQAKKSIEYIKSLGF
jgi:protein O-mannosyl-transferase